MSVGLTRFSTETIKGFNTIFTHNVRLDILIIMSNFIIFFLYANFFLIYPFTKWVWIVIEYNTSMERAYNTGRLKELNCFLRVAHAGHFGAINAVF